MAKSFKRAIACLLAVLMVAFSMPFTALAAPGDYEPDMELLFYPVWTNDYFDYGDIVGAKGATVAGHVTDGPGDVALDYNVSTGTIKYTKSKFATLFAEYEMDLDEYFPDGDYTIGAGDFFAVTVICKNITTINSISTAISYSDNLIPAGTNVTSTGSGRNKVETFHLVAGADEIGYFNDISAETYYGMDTEMNEIDANGNMFVACAGDSPYSDVSAVDEETAAGFTDPTTGALGWDAAGNAILGTFIFQYTGEGPITFEAADPNNEIYGGYAGGLYIADEYDGIAMKNYTTVAPQAGCPGSQKMTYFADWSNVPEDTYYTVTYTGDDIEESTEQVIENGSPATIPALPTSDDAHVSYAWDVNPSGAVITEDTTFTVVKTIADHVWSDWTVTTPAVAPTCTEAGTTAVETRTCSVGGETETRGGEEVAALGHNYEETVTAPTCTEQGYTTYTCSRCGDTYVDDYVAALGHDWGEWTVTTEAVAPTCTEAGATAIETRTCSRCGETETRGGDEVAALGHTAGEAVIENNVDPTCTEGGSYDTVVYCTVCGTELSRETTTVEALGHNYEATVTAPTCTEQGYTTYTCSRCGDTYVDDYVAALGHDWGEWQATGEAIPSTCVTPGVSGGEIRYCSRCEATETRGGEALPLDPNNHENVVTDEAVAPTCTETGLTEGSHCEACGAAVVAQEVVPALGHNYEATVTAPTCTEQGYTTYTCSRCGDTYVDDYTEALGHDLGEWTVTTEAVAPTCTEAGTTAIETRTCSRCDYSETRGGEEVPALGHTAGEAVIENNVDPTCTEGGSYDTVVYCAVCGTELSRETTTVEALGHDWGEWEAAGESIPSTCVTPGVDGGEIRYCSRCEATETRGGEALPLDPNNHENVVTDEAVAPTCTETGLTEGSHCEACGTVIVAQEEVPALGHDLGEWTVTTEAVAPTCTEAGTTAIETRTCSRCDYSETRGGEVIDALGHDWGEWTVTKAATKNEAGVETRTCSRCGEQETRAIPALGVIVSAVDFANGTVTFDGAAVDGNTKSYAYGADYTLVATANAGYKFVGWEVSGRIITDKAAYSNVAYTDMELKPIFVEDSQSTFTVTFVDKNGSVFKTLENVTEVTAEDIPEAIPSPGQIFNGWTIDGKAVTEEEICALTNSAVVWATFAKDENAEGYTVTVDDGVTLSLPSGVENGSIPYNTKATVSATDALAWKVNGSIVAYGDSYTFYVGTDVTVEAVFDAVEEKPTVAIIANEKVANTTNKQVVFATQGVPAGYTVKDRGFIVGKADSFGEINSAEAAKAAALVDTQPAGVKKSSGIKVNSDQFSVSFAAKAGLNMRAFAYIVVTSKSGGTEVIYSDVYDFVAL